MIPYVEWNMVTLGPVTLRVWGLFAATGVLAGTAFAMREAKRRGLDLLKVESLAIWTIVWTFLGARLFHVIAYEPAWYLTHPSEILMVWKGGLSSFGGFIGAAASFFWQMRKSDLPLFKTADAFVLATPLGLGCGRIGCFLIHDHPGTVAHGWGTVIATLYPTNTPRYDLGLLLAIFDFLLFGVFLLLLRKPRQDGFYFALFMLVYGPVRFLLDFLRIADARYFGLTPAQYGSLLLFFVGLFVMLKRVKINTALGSASHG